MFNLDDLKKMKPEELSSKVTQLKTELFNKKFQGFTVGVQKSHELKNMKKDIARVLTFINSKNKNKV
jgi:large subunit ribosomal protein L29